MIPLFAALLVAAQAPAEPCLDRILDYAGWREAPDQNWDYRWPATGQARLTMIGAEHLRDPAHPQFPRIAAAFTAAAPTLVFFEGPDRGVAESGEETIRSRGESGYVRFLAAQGQIPTRSLEPSPGEQFAMLLASHPADQVGLFFVLRETARLRDREGKAGAALDEAVATLLQRAGAMMGSGSGAFPIADLAALRQAAGRYWPGRDWRTFPADWFSPLADDAVTGGRFLGAINRADSANRNRYMVGRIVAAVRADERVLVVVGRNHVPLQAPAFACAFQPAR